MNARGGMKRSIFHNPGGLLTSAQYCFKFIILGRREYRTRKSFIHSGTAITQLSSSAEAKFKRPHVKPSAFWQHRAKHHCSHASRDAAPGLRTTFNSFPCASGPTQAGYRTHVFLVELFCDGFVLLCYFQCILKKNPTFSQGQQP